VPAEHHHFISLVRAGNLRDGDVRRLAFRIVRVLNVELDRDRRAVLDDAEDAAVVVVPKNRARRLRRRVVVNLSAAVLRDDEARNAARAARVSRNAGMLSRRSAVMRAFTCAATSGRPASPEPGRRRVRRRVPAAAPPRPAGAGAFGSGGA
jgi:hypothetical protein